MSVSLEEVHAAQMKAARLEGKWRNEQIARSPLAPGSVLTAQDGRKFIVLRADVPTGSVWPIYIEAQDQ